MFSMKKQIVLVGILIIACLANGVQCQNACEPTCSCCDGGCSFDQCTGGCIDGHYNGYYQDNWNNYPYYGDCRNQCRSRCKACTSYNECNACIDGHYNGYYLDKQFDYPYRGNCRNQCRSSCKSCTSYNQCSACIDGYYGTTCNSGCQEKCLTCSNYYNCGECKPGFYGTVCSAACSPGCVDGKCLQINGACDCKTGFHGSRCDTCVSGKYGTNCQSDCLQNCKACTSNTICNECYSGYYGQVCSPCSFGCNTGVCDNFDGTCSCKTEFSGPQCNVCIDGRFGHDCSQKCRTHCKSCSSYDICTACNSGHYGSDCQNTCSLGCYNYVCNIDNGQCSNGCVPDKYGSYCDSNCPTNCVSCQTEAFCYACQAGFFGSDCSTACPIGCRNAICEKASGACADGCINGKHGITCNSSCPVKCTACTSSTSCQSCITWHKGKRCQEECSNCKYNTTCNPSSGYCEDSCLDGKNGYWCTASCEYDCKSCYRYDRYKCNKCINGRYGRYSNGYSHCNNKCSTNCLNKTCDENTGYCVDCIEGYKGDKCECPINCECSANSKQCTSCVTDFANTNKQCQCRKDVCKTSSCEECENKTYYVDTDSMSCCQCSKNCKDTECISENECLTGCINGFFGKVCDMLCSTIDSNCVVCSTLKDDLYKCNTCDDGYYHDEESNRCIQCHITCLDRKCNSSTGKCLDGCYENYWGDKCEDKCNQTECLICNRENGACEVCMEGKYSKECTRPCSNTCNKTNQRLLCVLYDGTCLNGCTTNTVYGNTCDKNCSNNCLNSECEWKTGECIHGCFANKYGPTCDIECGLNCLSDYTDSNTRCFDKNGTCVSGCQPGYYGDMCEKRCSINCKNITCERLLGECHHGCIGDFSDDTCLQALRATDSSNGAVIGGAVGGVIALVLAVFIVLAVLFILRRRRNNKPQCDYANNRTQNKQETNARGPIYGSSSESVNIYSLPTTDMADADITNIANPNYELQPESIHMSALPAISNEELEEEEPDAITPVVNPIADRTYANVVRRIQVHKLAEYVAKKKTTDFEEEYQDFKLGLQADISYAASQKPNNMAKNRYRFIYPYDDHRVKLTGTGTDYINASYIDGFNKQNEYIACLGPTEKTTDKYVNFWRMVWQQKVEKIVMVTNLFENGGHKCDKYWPDTGTSNSYGDVTVTCHSEDVYADYTVRSFTVSQISQNRSLYHIHFTAWPDKGVPDDVTSLIEFRQKVKSTQTTLNGPTIVHCSAGVGRTGTYIALDILTNEGEAQKTVDIFGCVEHMREHRVNMVQTAEQYEYLHHAVVHSLTFECQAIPGDMFQQFISSLSDSDLQKMFERLQTTAEKETQGEKEAVQKHKTLTKLNRAGANVPGDRHRPKLYLHRKPGSSDYINAVNLNSFRSKDRYIVTQTALPETVMDFICLVYQTKCTCIVSMEPMEALKGKKVGKYFPADNQTLTLEPFKITSAIEETTPQYQLRKLTIARTEPIKTVNVKFNKYHALRISSSVDLLESTKFGFVKGTGGSNERTIHHFNFTQWKEKQLVPVDLTAMLQLVKDVDTKANKSEDKGPIIIHCLNGGEKSGLFCAVSVLIQKMAIEHEVSVVNTVRMVKSRRASAIPNKEQYSFCYQCVSAYLQSFDIYSNFSLRI